jgi:hypothetical protein
MSSPLYDMMAEQVRLPSTDAFPDKKDFAELDRAFLSAEVIVSTNVTQYFFAGTDQEQWFLDRHFPNLAPPFDSFWIETKAPTHILSEHYGTQSWEVSDSQLYQRPVRWAAWFLNLSMESLSARKYLREAFGTEIPHGKFWMYTVTVFRQEETDSIIEPMWVFTLLIDRETGQVVRNPKGNPMEPFLFGSSPLAIMAQQVTQVKAAMQRQGRDPDEPLFSMRGADVDSNFPQTIFHMFENEALLLVKPLLLAISFMHCRNVERVVHHPAPKQNKARVARNLPPFNRFHTLTIGPMQRIIDAAAASYRGLHGRSGIEMALHQARGHFKTYTEAKPLMGHAVGTWFWGATTRGTKARGTVKKNYEVHAK